MIDKNGNHDAAYEADIKRARAILNDAPQRTSVGGRMVSVYNAAIARGRQISIMYEIARLGREIEDLHQLATGATLCDVLRRRIAQM